MTDVQLQTALTRLAPPVDEAPAWDNVVQRAGAGGSARWKLAVIAVAMLATAAVVTGALAEGLLSGTLDRLSAWVGDQPGKPAPDQQAAFDQENASSYAHFPSGTRVGRLLSFRLDGQPHQLLGFRDGSNLCLRIVPSLSPTVAIPECVPQDMLTRLGTPVATIGAEVRIPLDYGFGRTIVYGLAADSVRSIGVFDDGRLLGEADVQNNAFFASFRDEPRSPSDPPGEGSRVVIRAHGAEGSADIPVRTRFGLISGELRAEDLPGPDRVERTLEAGSIGWLERGEPRGEPFAWPYPFPDRVLYSRLLAPDPTSSFRLAVAYGEDPDWQENGRWFCTAWLWPLVPDSRSNRGCGRANLIDSGLTYLGTSPLAGGFPHYVGLASDAVARIEIFYEDGSTQNVPLIDNVFSFYVAADLHSKLVAYDREGQVVTIHLLS
jgi:hypothetical protein